jgi:hypothetical protein
MRHFPIEDAARWQSRHRGPYRFLVTRPSKGRNKWRSEWLPGQVPTWDAEDEAQALLTDKRDSILVVQVWSVKEDQFVMTFGRLPRAEEKKEKAA